jgi:hypothetical protein
LIVLLTGWQDQFSPEVLMSSLSWNAGACQAFPPSVQSLYEKKAAVLRHVAASQRLTDVRPASRLEVRPRPEMLSSGVPELDVLTGGIPRGYLTEIYGGPSSGKSTVLTSSIAAATQRGEACVLIDASDSFDPSSAARAGVEFGKFLWVRCGTTSSALGLRLSAKSTNGGNNRRPFVARPERSEGTDCAFGSRTQKKSNEHRLEQVLKTTDLVLQSGGFGLVALNLAGIPEKFVRRIPLASWFRFQRTIEHTKTALLVVSEFACAQTCTALALKVGNQLSALSSQPSGKPAHALIFEGLPIEAEVAGSRLERKPMHSVGAVFESKTVRTG